MLAVAGGLAERRPLVGPALERVPGDDVERVAPRAVGDAAPAPDAASAAKLGRDDGPARDPAVGERDADQLALHRQVAVRAGPSVDRAVHEQHRPPDQLAPVVAVEHDRPARALGAGREVERVQPAEGVGDVERARRRVDHRRPRHAPAVRDLRAGREDEAADVDPPADVAVRGQRVDEARRRGDVHRRVPLARDVARHQRLRRHRARERGEPARTQRPDGRCRRTRPRAGAAERQPAGDRGRPHGAVLQGRSGRRGDQKRRRQDERYAANRGMTSAP